jgi:integrase
VARKKKSGRSQANGQGTKTVLPSGRVRWRLKDSNDQTLASGTADDDKAANEAIAAAITARAQGTLTPNIPVAMSTYAETYLAARAALGFSTTAQYKRHLDLALEYLPDGLSVQNAEAHHIRKMLSSLAARTGTSGLGKDRVTSSTVLAKILTIVRALFREAITDRLIHRDPTLGVKRVKVARIENPGISLDYPEIARLQALGSMLHAIGSSRLWPALFTCASVGLRRGEALALIWIYLNLERGILSVRQNLVKSARSWEIKPHPKTEAGNRDILMPPSLIRTLKALKVAQQLECERLGITWSERLPVFATHEMTHSHPDNLNRALEAILEWSEAGPITRKRKTGRTNLEGTPEVLEVQVTLERRLKSIDAKHRPALRALIESGPRITTVSPHDLRHTCGSLWLRRKSPTEPGRPIEVVSRDLGHQDINVTYKIYRHVLESEREQHVRDLFPLLKSA